jgi:hypothetical protein
VGGRATCAGIIGWVVEDGLGVRDVEFQPFYRARLHDPNSGEPLSLEIMPAAMERLDVDRLPLPGRRNKMLVYHRWELPATAPCHVSRLHGESLVEARILTMNLPVE